MGFFQDLFGGDFGAVGNDIGNFLSNPVNDIALAGSVALPFLAPELLGAAAAGEAGSAALGGALGGAVGGEAALGGSTALGLAGDVGATAAGSDLSTFLANPGEALTPTGGVSDASALVAPSATPAAPGGLTGTDLGSALTDSTSGTAGTDLATVVNNAGGPAQSQSLFDKLVTGATNQVTKNPIGLGLGTAGLATSLLKGNKKSPEEEKLAWEGAVAQQQGNQLQSYTTSGTLPAAQQAQLDAQIQAAKARIIQNHATQGRSTDPSQNSALAQELNNVDMQALALKGDLQQKLFAQGTQDLQLSQEMLTTVANFDRADQKAVGDALMNFAKAMSPASPTVDLSKLLPKQA